jgi:hypothetical protein
MLHHEAAAAAAAAFGEGMTSSFWGGTRARDLGLAGMFFFCFFVLFLQVLLY